MLGEFQLAFLIFLVGQSFAGFEQWKRFIVLLCQCEAALAERLEFFFDFIGAFLWLVCRCFVVAPHSRSPFLQQSKSTGVLTVHVEQAPDDFFHDPVSNKNFLMPMLSRLFDNVESARALLRTSEQQTAYQRLLRRVNAFRALVERKFASEFDADDDSDEPIVVY